MDINNLENQFNKALRLLDLDKTEKAVSLLNDIIVNTSKESNSLYYIRANCVLGELLFLNGRKSEAKKYLIEVLNTPYEDDLVDYEKSIASDIMNQMK